MEDDGCDSIIRPRYDVDPSEVKVRERESMARWRVDVHGIEETGRDGKNVIGRSRHCHGHIEKEVGPSRARIAFQYQINVVRAEIADTRQPEFKRDGLH